MNQILFYGDKVRRILFRVEALLLSWIARHCILRIENRKTKQGVLKKHVKILVCIKKFH